jgi:uncharacterized surface protein with fasciclin (FAS1) repeats
MSHPVIVAARRTASGKFGGLLAKVPAPQLGAFVIEAMLADAPAAKAAIEECIMGNVLQAGVGQNPARQAGLLAGLAETLAGEGPFTVFAPTDEAFAKLPAGTVETLLKPENKEKLKEILLLHVVPGSVMAADVVKLKDAKTAGGKTVMISTDGGVKVGTATGMAKVVKTDIKAKNGVIHVIDAVILP